MTILLVSGATATLRKFPLDAPVGHLVTPFTGNSIYEVARSGRPWAADNGCGPKRDGTPGVFDEQAYREMLDNILAAVEGSWTAGDSLIELGIPNRWPLWIVAPDVVGDWLTTRKLWSKWFPILVEMGFRQVAYVAQDGQPWKYLPVGALHCLFIGGSTAYKESDEVLELARRAANGRRIHVGRVNSERRLRLFDNLGMEGDGYPRSIDSVDGTQFSMFPDVYIPRWIERLQPTMRRYRSEKVTPMDTFWKADK